MKYHNYYICHTHKVITPSTWRFSLWHSPWRCEWTKVQATDETTQRFLDTYGFTASERQKLEAMTDGH